MNKSILFVSYLFMYAIGYSQNTFQKAYGGSGAENSECIYEVETIKQTSDNGYAICNTTQTFAGPGNSGAYFLKLKQNGDTAFAKTFYRSNPVRGRSVHQTPEGGYLLGIDYTSINSGLIKLDTTGNILWSKDLIPDISCSGYHSIPLKDGGYLVSGGGSFGSSLCKVDLNGNLVYSKRHYSSQNNIIVFYSSSECSNGDIISVGYYYNTYTYGLVMRSDASGNIKFSKIYNISNNVTEVFKSVELSDKSVVICGYVEYSNYNRDALLVKIDSLGNTISVKTIGDTYSQRTTNIIKDENDNLFIAGQANNLLSNDAGLLIKVAPAGNIVFSKTYLNGAMCEGIALTSDKGIVMEGMTTYFGSGITDIYVFKTDSNGAAGCNVVNNPLPVNPILNYTVSNLPLLTSSNQFTVQNATYSISCGTQINVKCQSITNGFNENSADNELILYPNPNNGFFILNNEDNSRKQIKLYNNLGQSVFEQEVKFGENRFDDKFLSQGIYTYFIFENGKQMTTGKLVKQ